LRRIVPVAVAVLFIPTLLFCQPAQPQSGQLDGNEAIFAVMCAIHAAGFSQEIESPTNHQLRKALRDDLSKRDLPSLPALRRFVRDHKPREASLELNQYISYALSTKGPPLFESAYPNLPKPPDVESLDGLTPLLVDFYQEAGIETLWKQAQPYYDQMIAQYSQPVSRAVLEVNAYLRNVTSGYLGRRFQIYVDLMAPPNQVQTRSYVDDYFVIVSPAAEMPVEDIRHAYLHYLADPLGIKFSADIRKKAALIDYAQGSPILSNIYKSDFNALSVECFIKAVEARIARKPAMVTQALREGYVLTPAFADALATYEKQEQAMRLYFPELVASIDLKREEKRLDSIDFLTERPVKKFTTTSLQAEPVLTGAEKTLDDAEKAYIARQLPRAKDLYLRVLKETEDQPMHAKAYYGLARVAVLERDPETGDRLFRKVLELSPDASTKSWSLLYLGRLADSQGDRQEAAQHYQAALDVKGVPESVRSAAEKGLKEAFTTKK
jgi:tetratricopeptide (TPR) repeat protein